MLPASTLLLVLPSLSSLATCDFQLLLMLSVLPLLLSTTLCNKLVLVLVRLLLFLLSRGLLDPVLVPLLLPLLPPQPLLLPSPSSELKAPSPVL